MRDGGMRILPDNRRKGIYVERANSHNLSCQIGLRVAGVIGSRKESKRVSNSDEMVPLGFIVFRPSCLSQGKEYPEEWVFHPRGCEVVEVDFHYWTLVELLQKSPLAERMEIPPPHLQPRVGGPAYMTRKRKREDHDAE